MSMKREANRSGAGARGLGLGLGRSGRALLAVWAVAMAACFDPIYPEGIACSEIDTCPPGQSCDVDRVCRRIPVAEPRCGDEVQDPGEACDDGNTSDGDDCSADCSQRRACGDGVQDPGEACDDGNTSDGDDCSADCSRRRTCGNGEREPGEACDDGNTADGDGCSAACLPEECGNEAVDPGTEEACDTGGNSVSCDEDCTLPACGDGLFNPEALTAGPAGDEAEACDTGDNSAMCDADCTLPACGDGLFNPEALTAGPEGNQAELCDTAGNSAACDEDCTLPRCGDGVRNEAADEECDDGNNDGGDGCSGECVVERLCGNGVLDPGEDVDPPPGPSTVVPVDAQTCRFDFSAITQLYCSGTCGNWDGFEDCQQGDADAFCRLRTGNPASTAIEFSVGAATAAPGICCPPPTLPDPVLAECVSLGTFGNRGVDLLVSVHETNLVSTHGAGAAITSAVCSDP
jgi:cysteine-rich repeat protein